MTLEERPKTARLGSRRVRRGYEQVAEQLHSSIIDGTLPAGSRLPTEPELAENFGTSRSTIREALRILSSQGFVETRPGNNGGTVVIRPSSQGVSEYLLSAFALWTDSEEVDLEDLFDARETLEATSVSWAASRSADVAIEVLEPFIPEDVSEVGVDELLSYDRGFHEAILKMSGNRYVHTVCLPIYNVMNKRVERRLIDPKVWHQIVDEHREMMMAISDGDSELATRLMQGHLRSVRAAYATVLPKRYEAQS